MAGVIIKQVMHPLTILAHRVECKTVKVFEKRDIFPSGKKGENFTRGIRRVFRGLKFEA